ncbi:unnamed protein product, partial [Brassica oleracea]
MKNDFQPSLIGLFIVTVLLFGVMTTARRPGYPCQHIYTDRKMENVVRSFVKLNVPKKGMGLVDMLSETCDLVRMHASS